KTHTHTHTHTHTNTHTHTQPTDHSDICPSTSAALVSPGEFSGLAWYSSASSALFNRAEQSNIHQTRLSVLSAHITQTGTSFTLTRADTKTHIKASTHAHAHTHHTHTHTHTHHTHTHIHTHHNLEAPASKH